MAPVEDNVLSSSSNNSKLIKNSCKKCDKRVLKGVMCTICENWYHEKCSLVSVNLVGKTVKWTCRECVVRDSENKYSRVISDKDATISELKRELIIINEQYQDLKLRYDYLLNKINHNSEKKLNGYSTIDDPDSFTRIESDKYENWRRPKKSFKSRDSQEPCGTKQILFSNNFNVLDCGGSTAVNNAKDNCNTDKIKNNCSQGQPSLKSSKHEYKNRPNQINIYSDSHGRGIASSVLDSGINNAKVTGSVKPGSKFKNICSGIKNDCANHSLNDFVVFIGGANDIFCNEATNFVKKLIFMIQVLHYTNVIVTSIPLRHDLPSWSCVNNEITKTNKIIKRLVSKFRNASFLDVSDFDRSSFTRHGLHLNKKGKLELSSRLRYLILKNCYIRENNCNVNSGKPIQLSWRAPEN